mgnify:CR=1 FL=1
MKYKTLGKTSQGLYKEKGSKFLSFAFPIATEEEAHSHLAELRKQYHDARHHCYAYLIGKNKDTYRANDDGEPNHSAGDPILGQIRSNDLTNVLVAVVRYFGGTKLGVGGLIQAYRMAAAEAIKNNEIIESEDQHILKIACGYLDLNEVMKIVKDLHLTIASQTFEEGCQMVVVVNDSQRETSVSRFLSIAGLRIF